MHSPARCEAVSLTSDMEAQENCRVLVQIRLPCGVTELGAVERGLRNVHGRGLRMRQKGDCLVIYAKPGSTAEPAHTGPLAVTEYTMKEIERLKKHIKFIAGFAPDGEPGRLVREECRKALFPEMT